jgi:adenine-specific DNA-methyltransferase
MGRPTRRSATPFRFLLNHSKATAPNVYLLLYPKPLLSELLAASPGLHREIWHRLGLITGEALVREGRITAADYISLSRRNWPRFPPKVC